MKVAFCIRPNQYAGGDMVQALKTREYLLKLEKDIQIDVLDTPEKLDKSFDVAHIFNYSTEQITNEYFAKALEMNIPIVSSPIYWDYSYAQPSYPAYVWTKGFITKSIMRAGKMMNKLFTFIPLGRARVFSFSISSRFRKNIHYYIEKSRFILPNSMEEGKLCYLFSNYKDPSYKKIRVVLNGVDVSGVSILKKESFFSKYPIPENYILQVGRIEFAKNQINLVEAMMVKPEIPIVFLGYWDDNARYYLRMKSAAERRGNVYFVKNVPHDEVYSFYYYAKTHVLLSFRESPGLVSLEALSQKCPIVIPDTRFLPVDTYFGNNSSVEVVDLFDKQSIVDGIIKSYNKPHIEVDLSRFSWLEVAKSTYSVYEEVLQNDK